jgi:PhnB protein
MSHIHSYLTFSGNCREAMNFYKDCLGGELFFQTVGETPLAGKMPEKMKNFILHSTLTNGNLVLMASDMVSEKGLVRGNAISLMLNCTSEEEIRSIFKKLSEGGIIGHKLEDTFWGAIIGDFTDKFGNNWLLHYDKNQK